MSIQTTAIVNSVGPTSGLFLDNYLDPRDGDENHPNGMVVITLTAQDGTFSNTSFLVDDCGTPLAGTTLATALAAINTSYPVLADVDWPPQVIDPSGDTAAIYCHSLWLNAG